MLHNLQKPTKAIRRAQLWAKRSTHLRTHLDNLALKKAQHLDAQALIRVFLLRKSLRLKLSDVYLAKLWRMSMRNVQYRLEQLEQAGLIKRFTQPPRKRPEGWRQERTICLIIRSSIDLLACKKSKQSKRNTVSILHVYIFVYIPLISTIKVHY